MVTKEIDILTITEKKLDDSFPDTICVLRHEQVCLIRLHFERYFSDHRAVKMIMSHIFKGIIRTWMETITLTDKKKLCNVTN